MSLLLILWLCAFAFVVWTAYQKQILNEVLPSFGWTAFMVLPFLLLKSSFAQNFLAPQTWGVFLFGVALLAGDALAVFRYQHSTGSFQGENLVHAQHQKALKIAFGAVVLLLLIQITHYFLMPQIPLWQKLFHGPFTDVELRNLRENAVKLLVAPPGFKYLCQATITVLTPLAFGLFIWVKRPVFAAVLYVNTAIYSMSALAKGPIITLTALCAVAFLSSLSRPKQFSVLRGLISLVVLGASANFLFLLLKNPSSLTYETKNPDPFVYPEQELGPLISKGIIDAPAGIDTTTLENEYKPIFTKVDQYRALRDDPVYLTFPGYEKFLNLYFYRAFMVPIEASHRWYHYYPFVYGRHLGLYGLTSSTRGSAEFKHPANIVAWWGYRSRFPSQYEPTANAYASADADAWSRWGYMGLFVVAMMVFCIRFALSMLNDKDGFFLSIYNCALFLLATALPAASIAALLVAQGLLFYILLLMAGRFVTRFI